MMITQTEEREIYDYWLNNIRNFRFSHTTSSIIAEEILKHGLDPNKRLNIFKEAIKLNNLLKKYALFGTSFLSPHVLERNYFYISPMMVYVAYKIPESLMHLLDFTRIAIEKLKVILPTNGDFNLFQESMRESRITIYTIKENYNKINFREFAKDFDEIYFLFRKIEDFEEKSTSVTLLIDNQAVLDILPENLREILSNYNAFRKTIFLWPEDKPKDVNKFVEQILETNEILVAKKINKKYISRNSK